MSILTIPTGLKVKRIEWGQRRADLEFGSGDTGVSQVRLLAPARWYAAIVCPDYLSPANAAIWRDLTLRLQGRVNQLAMYDMSNPAPRGTMRGTLTLASAAAQGATTLSITGGVSQAGTTLLAGDWIGVGAGATRQLVNVAADATANGSGVISVTISQPMRLAQLIAAAVTWDKPTALFRQTGSESTWSFERKARSGHSLDLIESWES